mgnify:CR=1 FL=1
MKDNIKEFPFGRPLCSQLKLGEMIYKELN